MWVRARWSKLMSPVLSIIGPREVSAWKDILVGKVSTEKVKTPVDAGGKALRAIFGEKASDGKIDTSSRVPTGTRGTIIDVQVFSPVTANRKVTRRAPSD